MTSHSSTLKKHALFQQLHNDDSVDLTLLGKHICELSVTDPPLHQTRWVIGIVGIPASGKSTFAKRVMDRANAIAKEEVCTYIGMDGFHYSRAHLDTMSDPKLAHQKRGAHWTFDALQFGQLLHRIRFQNQTDNNKNNNNNNNNNNSDGGGGGGIADAAAMAADIIAPTFDHSKKDPVANGTVIKPHHRVVLVEGLYLFLDLHPWNECVVPHFNEKWLISCSYNLAQQRIVKRHIESGVVDSEANAIFRWLDNDKPNGTLLLTHMSMATINVIVHALPDGFKIKKINWDSSSAMSVSVSSTHNNNNSDSHCKTGAVSSKI